MIRTSGIIYYHEWDYRPRPDSGRNTRHVPRASTPRYAEKRPRTKLFGLGLLALALGGLVGPLTPFIRLEANYRLMQARVATQSLTMNVESRMSSLPSSIRSMLAYSLPGVFQQATKVSTPKPVATPVLFNPLTGPDGDIIKPVDTDFGLVIPKIGVNAKVIPAVNPANPGEYEAALTRGVAHASTSYFPNEDGTVYLFSHSTSYDWFVKDLNAVFYLVKNLETGDTIVLLYKGKEYTYRISDKRVVSPEAVSYLVPHAGTRQLILQTCWPPGSVAERLLIFADLMDNQNEQI